MSEDQIVEYESRYTYVTDTYAHDMYFQAHGDWIFKITKDGFVFNREAFPDWSPDDFAKEIIDLLENSYAVTFTPRNKHTEENPLKAMYGSKGTFQEQDLT